MDQIFERKRREIVQKNEKNKKKTIKDLVHFNNFISDEVVEPRQKRLFNLVARNVKQEIINSHRQ